MAVWQHSQLCHLDIGRFTARDLCPGLVRRRAMTLAVVLFLPLAGFLLAAPRATRFKGASIQRFRRKSRRISGFLGPHRARPSNKVRSFTSVIDLPWIDGLGFQIRFHLGVDGINLWLILLTTLLVPIAVWMTGSMVADRRKGFLRSVAVIRIRLDRCLFGARSVRLLHLLGSGLGAHVSHGRIVGRRAPRAGGGQIFRVHDARLRADARLPSSTCTAGPVRSITSTSSTPSLPAA